MKLSLIIPCFNEQEALPLFYDEVTAVLNTMQCAYEILFVNDGSRDETLTILKGFAEKDEHVTYLSLSRNFGKEAAMYAGFCNASGDYVAVMDADMQDPPALLPEMVKMLETGDYDSVATRRVNREGEPPIRSWFARKFYKLINRISDADIVDGARDFRLMKREMVDAIVAMSEYNRFSKGIFGWIGFKTYWLPYQNVERVAGETKWNFWKLLKYAFDGIINFSEVPLSIASWSGIGMAFVADGYPLYYDGVNEKGLGMAGLNFVGNAAYEEALPEDETEVSQVAQFEFIPWILTQCATVAEAREKLAAMRLTGTAFSEQLPTAQLHWIIADKDSCIVVESMKDGLHVYDNPVGVLTNNPPFPSQMFALNNYAGVSRKQPESTFAGVLQLDAYSRGMGGMGIPGDLSSQSRFVKVAFTKLNSISDEEEDESVSQFFHILGSVDQQRGCCEVTET